jgi:two-component system, sensor histidine kinase and response regulator
MNTAAKILIAEDSSTQSLLLQNILERHGFEVTTASNGQIALDKLASLRPALVISDIQMPVMDGYTLCQRINESEELHDIPVMLLTSLSAPQDIIRGLECGADNFVVKPFKEDFLMARIATVLANQELPQGDARNGIEVEFAGERYTIEAGRRQILNLLLSTYETAVQANADLLAAHEQLKAMQAQLIEAEKLQTTGRLAAGVAHEVRNPLAILEMGIDFLTAQEGAREGEPILAEMREAVRRTNVVVSSLMDMAAPRDLGMADTDVHTVIAGALTALAEEIARAKVRVDREFADDIPTVRLDAAKIEQALVNILSNALRAMPEGGTLTVKTGMRAGSPAEVSFDAGDRSGARSRGGGGRSVMIEICDTGPGISPENMGKVFEPFFSTRPTGEGMGLGLTVARKMVELHKGRIEIQNQPGGGAAVTILFPAP